MTEHKTITFEGRTYKFDPSCTCAGCKSLRRYPDSAKCDWCHQEHSGGPEHCNTEEYGPGDDIRGADETLGPAFERYLESLCSVIRDRVAQITNTVKELNKEMLPQPGTSQPTGGRNRGGNQKTSVRLTIEYLIEIGASTTQFKEAKILATQYEPKPKYQNSKPQVVCKVAINGEIKFWNIGIENNPNYQLLVDKFGNDENDWADKKILLGLEGPNFYNNYFIRVDFPEEKKSKSGK